MLRLILGAVSLFIVISCTSVVQAASSKVALVIGINEYAHAPRLKNPISDAKSVARVLKRIGFDVSLVTDLDRSGFETKLSQFSIKSAKAAISFVYYAGHGIQVHGETYLIPTDARLIQQRDVRFLISASDVLKDAARAGSLAVVVLDACRDNPFTRSLAEAMGARSTLVGRGLSRILDVPRNTLIAYATQAGNIALDGAAGNSPYAIALTQHLGSSRKDVRMIFGAVRDTVLALTNQRQEPFTYGSLGGTPLYLATSGDGASNEAVAAANSPNLTTVAAIVPRVLNSAAPIDNVFAAWQAAKKSEDWGRIEQFRNQLGGTLYGRISAELLKLRARDQALGVTTAIAKLTDIPADLGRLPSRLISLVQRKLSSASYYGLEPTGRADAQTREAMNAFVRDIFDGGSVSYQSLLALAELSDSQNVTESLSGTWRGRYYYKKAINGVTNVPFEMNLVLSQGRVTGNVSEPNTFGDKTSNNLYADFSGKIIGDRINWKKTYDGTGGVSHSVRYSGRLDRRRRRVEGTWKITGDWTGRFYIELR